MDDRTLTRYAVQAGQGDRRAAEQFVRATQQAVYRLLVHLSSPAVAEDLAQETYLRAFGSLARFRADASARTWLLGIARRVAADHLRRRARSPRQVDGAGWQHHAERAQPRLPGAEDNLAIRHALALLAADRREAFVLTQVLGLSYAETAEVCRCRIGTVRSRVARARNDLRQALNTGAGSAAADSF